MHGACHCAPGYTGPDCSLPACGGGGGGGGGDGDGDGEVLHLDDGGDPFAAFRGDGGGAEGGDGEGEGGGDGGGLGGKGGGGGGSGGGGGAVARLLRASVGEQLGACSGRGRCISGAGCASPYP